MTTPVQLIPDSLPDPVKIVENGDDLCQIGRDGVGGVIWRRQIPEEFRNWIDGLDPQLLPSARAILHPQDTRALVTDICDAAKTPAGSNREWLIDDVCALADRFVDIMSSPYLQLRFDVVADDACRKFHRDMVRARLICTYRGRGTQYGIAHGAADPQRISDVPAGAPIFLRGNLWHDPAAGDLRHRSPPIAGTGETRLILVLDAVQNRDDPRRVQLSEPKRSIAKSRNTPADQSADEVAG